jgi:hypothetical protein
MNSEFKLFKDELDEIRAHIEFVDNLSAQIKRNSTYKKYIRSNSKKKFEYKSLIISLYGLVENFTEKFVITYLENLEKEIFYYDSLNETLKKNHFNQSITLISKVLENKHQKFSKLNQNDILNNLNGCVSKKLPYILNTSAFTLGTGNLKHNKVKDIFALIDINLNNELQKRPRFMRISQSENVFNPLDDLVDRRNEIAHGNTLSILDTSEIIPIVDFLEEYFKGLFETLNSRLKSEITDFKKKTFSVELRGSQVFPGRIFGIVNGKNLNLQIGRTVYIERNSGIKTSKIKEIKIHSNDDATFKLTLVLKTDDKFFYFDNLKYSKEKTVIKKAKLIS